MQGSDGGGAGIAAGGQSPSATVLSAARPVAPSLDVDMFRQSLAQMIDMNHPLAVLGSRLPWDQIEQALAPLLAHKARSGKALEQVDLFGPSVQLVGAGVSAKGRPRLSTRLMASLLYLKHRSHMSDEQLVQHWAENVVWQHFSGMQYYEPRLPCDATQLGRFRSLIGEAGVEELLKATIDCAVSMRAIEPEELERVIVDTTVQEKAIAHPADSRLLEVARYKVCKAAKACGIVLKQTYAKEGKQLRRKAGGYAHAKQFKRLKRVLKRQRTVLGKVMRAVQRQMQQLVPKHEAAAKHEAALGLTSAVFEDAKLSALQQTIERATRIQSQQRKDKNKLYAMHAPEVECIGKGKARKPYEFGVKVGVVVTHKQGLMLGCRSHPGNPYDGHILAEQLEQASILMEGIKAPSKPDEGSQAQTNAAMPQVPPSLQSVRPKEVYVDLGFRGADADNPEQDIVHRGKAKSLSKAQWKLLKRRQAIEPAIGHLKHDHGMDRCHLLGQTGDALHAVLCAAGYNIAWLLRAIKRLGIQALLPLLRALFKLRPSNVSAHHKEQPRFKWMPSSRKLLLMNYNSAAA